MRRRRTTQGSVYEICRPILGTLVTVTAACTDAELARKIIGLAFEEIYRVHNLMNVHDENSEIGILNKHGIYESASPYTIEVIRKAVFYSELTGGAFNIASLPVLRLWGKSIGMGKSPKDSEIAKALALAHWKNIIIEDRSIRFDKIGMGITLGAVAKGYAVDKAIEVFKNNGMKRAMVNGGGDIRVMAADGDRCWKIGIRSPNRKEHLIGVVSLTDEAIATSGTYQRRIDDIFEFKSGRPAQDVRSSTVIAETAIEADALSTAIYALGAERGMELIERLNGIGCMIVTKDGELMSRNLEILSTESPSA